METQKFMLLSGSYAPSEARELLVKMIDAELQFHRLLNFTSLIRFEGTCAQATENIKALCQAREEVDRLVQAARDGNLRLQLKTQLQLALVEQEVEERRPVAVPCV